MAEQKFTVKLDSTQVSQLQQFVRDEIRKARGPVPTVTATSELAELRAKIEAMADEYERAGRLVTTGAVAGMLREWIA